MKITFTGKELTAWGGACSVVAKFLEQIEFRQWVDGHVPVEEHSPNAKGIYPKVLSLFLARLTWPRASPIFDWTSQSATRPSKK